MWEILGRWAELGVGLILASLTSAAQASVSLPIHWAGMG